MRTKACLGMDPEIWFPVNGGAAPASARSRRDAEAAAAICRRCPVQEGCADIALKTDARHGVWAAVWLDDPDVPWKETHATLARIAGVEVLEVPPTAADSPTEGLPDSVIRYREWRAEGVSNERIAQRLGVKVESLRVVVRRHGVDWIGEPWEIRLAERLDELIAAGEAFSANDFPRIPGISGLLSGAMYGGRIKRVGSVRSASHGGKIGAYCAVAEAGAVVPV
ncbi:WhiB family transcriptional regulator [Rhodococcus sp. NPDC003318]|uniref:WhiB family transcriptional regulator n=1 Tax=Rhodococcus sp. NPDC003318 TaxID=3364503 RepID=UPI00369CDBD2